MVGFVTTGEFGGVKIGAAKSGMLYRLAIIQWSNCVFLGRLETEWDNFHYAYLHWFIELYWLKYVGYSS